jgi:hypothetical protein
MQKRERWRTLARGFAIQAMIWIALTVAFAGLLRLAGPQQWPNALKFAAMNWLPWVILTPLVLWFSGRFPLERGYLLKSVPAHAFGCVVCVTVTLWIATTFGFSLRTTRAEGRSPTARDEGAASSRSPATSSQAVASSSVELRERFDRPWRGESRSGFPRRSGPSWWPSLGATLQRANFDAAVYFIVVVAAHALAFYRRAQERESHAATLAAGLNRAKLDALRLQLQPHFLFNTLNAISTLVHRDADAADELIGDLSDLLRLSLQTSDHEVPLSRELELLDCYLGIEQARLGDRLRVVREIAPDAINGLVPTFVLQPLVENAIRHGIEPRVAPGTIMVRARRDVARLHLEVCDDGLGAAGSEVRRSGHGIGLTNTIERLKALHGSAAALTVETPAAGGFVVRLQLPYATATLRPPLAGDASPVVVSPA